jgi:hypothetical protein
MLGDARTETPLTRERGQTDRGVAERRQRWCPQAARDDSCGLGAYPPADGSPSGRNL